MADSEKNSKKRKQKEIRFVVKGEDNLYDMIEELENYFSPVKTSEIAKMLIEKGYIHWFMKEIKGE